MRAVHLYVKTHRVTGMRYFGKTVKENVHAYRGSGVYWQRHIAEHGYDVDTELIATFTDSDELEAFALAFSAEHDIVTSREWANLIEENGRSGKPVGAPGRVFSEEELLVISRTSRERWADPEYRERVAASHRSRLAQPGARERVSAAAVRQWTPEARQVQAEKMSARFATDNAFREAFHAHVRKPRSPKHKASIATALSQKAKSPEHRAALSASARDRQTHARVPSGFVYLPDRSGFSYRGFVVRRHQEPNRARRWVVEEIGTEPLRLPLAKVKVLVDQALAGRYEVEAGHPE